MDSNEIKEWNLIQIYFYVQESLAGTNEYSSGPASLM